MKIAIIIAMIFSALTLPAEIKLYNSSMQVDFRNGQAVIMNTAGQTLMTIKGLTLQWTPPMCDSGNATQNAPDSVTVDYQMTNDPGGKIKLRGIFTLQERILKLKLELTAPADTRLGGAALRRSSPVSNPALIKAGIWRRHDHGGVPVEDNDGVYRRFATGQTALYEVINGNPEWSDNQTQNIKFNPTGTSGFFQAETTFFLAPAQLAPEAAIAGYQKRPAAVTVTTDQPFNLCEPGEKMPNWRAAIFNTGTTAQNGTLQIQLRDFDGVLVVNRQEPLSLAAGQTHIIPLPFPETTGCYFAEVAYRVDGKEFFSRTSLGVLPPYDFQHRDKSIFGIAATFDIPTHQTVATLLKRMGVRWVRNGDTRLTLNEFGAISNCHSNVKPDQWQNDPAQKTAMFKKMLSGCDQRQNPYWEFGNEWNMSSLHTGKKADTYVNDWLKPLAKVKAEGHYQVKLLSMGIAGDDIPFLKKIHEEGGWPLLDGIAFHPGRGNFTPDYTGSGWTYLGTIRRFQEAVRQFGVKPLWITEAYACTQPNDWWHDSERRAAENIILTYAIGLAEGMKSIMFYQMHDSVWFNKGGINLKDSEYSYGLLRRDGTIKPSLLAYCTIAEALDGASFRQYLKFPDPQIKGISFNTPRGPMAILWQRTDGYVQSKKADHYATPEPWVEHWKSKVNMTFRCQPAGISVIDCIGRRRQVAADHGNVKLDLTGAPLIVYGLNL